MNDVSKPAQQPGKGKRILKGILKFLAVFYGAAIVLAIIFGLIFKAQPAGEHAVALSTAVKQLEATGWSATQTRLAANTATPPPATSTPTLTLTPTLSFEASFATDGNVRSGPGLDFPVAAVKKSGETAVIYGRSGDNQWLMIDPSGQQWVHVSVAKANVQVDSLPLAPTLTPTEGPTPTATITPIPAVSITDVYNNLEELTQMQFNTYKNNIIGRPVRETVEVSNVLDDGRVSISGPWTPMLFNVSKFGVVVEGMPRDIAIALHSGDHIYLEATIRAVVGDYNYFNNRENTLVLTYKSSSFTVPQQ